MRLARALQNLEETKPSFLKEILHEKHLSRVGKNQIKREVREDHKKGIADPGRLAARAERRMYFGEHIKINNSGKHKHVVNK